jgi:hypothetical protein
MIEKLITLYARSIRTEIVRAYRIRATELNLTMGELLAELAQFLPRIRGKK